ncbi:TonB-dependent receptor domain-containing protein [Acinetobacter sp. MD2(2019)]|uniref:TonB-dependent receptor domain-containing protein n=1 Tax=Acinetobacter sp. MD2(2019) TaxID=2605273 RepID=UPI002D1E6CCE|nr:TonB-dependent receptor [Acinetobacter sp. MD2(2019)]MEB3754267.1 TonB-dependent receptor [Acinetobacter sp. MD2(2019)]
MANLKQYWVLSLLACSVQQVMAAQVDSTDTVNLPTLSFHVVAAKPESTQILTQQQLLQGGSTIGNALNGLAGIYSAQYTGGVSRPVMRGQDGARVKITQNGGDALDVSSVSPDHAVTVDPNSADKIEVLTGPETLMYGAGSVGGLVNVDDHKIPTKMPDNGYEGRVGVRYNTGDDGLIYSGDTTIGLGSQVALNVGGLKRDANDYILPRDLQQTDSRRENSTFADSKDYHAGLSWIYDRGFTGISFSQRHDQYGIPGDVDSAWEPDDQMKLSLPVQLDDDEAESSSWINLKQKRYDFKTQLDNPFAGFSRITAQANRTIYQHAEMDGDTPATLFHSTGTDARIVLDNNPWAGWNGQFGLQYTSQALSIDGEEALMAATHSKRYSLFGLQQKQFGDVTAKVSTRIDHQEITVDSDQKNFNGTAYSAAGELAWEFVPNHKLTFDVSHQERLPLAQELYSNGGLHGPTKSFEFGNDSLSAEKSNNVSLGVHGDQDALHYNLSIYHNWFDNFIYANTIDQKGDFRSVYYQQTAARFYGADADVSYQFTPVWNVGVFGDYVRGKLEGNGNAPRVPGGRVGTRINANFADGYNLNAEYSHVFNQADIADYETVTQGYNMLNLGFGYNGTINAKTGYNLYLKANNLLDAKVYQHESFLANVPQIGRNFTVGVDFKF